ncbi:hypothetical protein ACFP1Z_28700 [Streptomyces gamaensis]|uniref:Uncharacterized protein n=1 Tax=Streptomyces gamaensis TaxID=1763542 RepID=A0ABW0Z8A4_9ACTN
MARDILIARQVRPLVGWTQSEGLRRLAFALRPLIDKGLDVHDIAAELHSWYLDWRPARPAAYITSHLRQRAERDAEYDARLPHVVHPQDNPAWRAWCQHQQAVKAMNDLITHARRTDEDRRQARLAARYNPHLLLDHVAEHGEDDALDLFGADLTARIVSLSHGTHIQLGTT